MTLSVAAGFTPRTMNQLSLSVLWCPRHATRVVFVLLTMLAAVGLDVSAHAQSLFDPKTSLARYEQQAPASADDKQEPQPGTPAPLPGPSAMAELIKPIPRDFVRLFTVDNAIYTGIGGAAAVFAHQVDENIADSGWGDSPQTLYESGQYLGDVLVNMAAGLTAYTAGRFTARPRLRAVGSGIFRSQIVSQALVQSVKPLVGRERPDGSNFHSFPSGHSATAFATATVVQNNLGWKWGIPAYAVATLTAASRIHHQRHYLSDVVFGATIGIVSARAVTVGRKELKFALAPAVTSDGWRLDFVKLN